MGNRLEEERRQGRSGRVDGGGRKGTRCELTEEKGVSREDESVSRLVEDLKEGRGVVSVERGREGRRK